MPTCFRDGTEPRLRIMQLLLSAHPEGLVVSEIQDELEIPGSTLSHHLDKLRNEDLVQVERKARFCAIPRTPKRCGNSAVSLCRVLHPHPRRSNPKT